MRRTDAIADDVPHGVTSDLLRCTEHTEGAAPAPASDAALTLAEVSGY